MQAKAKRNKNEKRGNVMITQEYLLGKMEEWGAGITSQTARNREKQGLTMPAYRGGAGRPGRSVFYPERVLWENYAASMMLNSTKMRLTAKEVLEARAIAIQLESTPREVVARFADRPEHERLPLRFACIWHALVVYAWKDCPESLLCEVSFDDVFCYFIAKNPGSVYNSVVYVDGKTREFKETIAVTNKDWRQKDNLVDINTFF